MSSRIERKKDTLKIGKTNYPRAWLSTREKIQAIFAIDTCGVVVGFEATIFRGLLTNLSKISG